MKTAFFSFAEAITLSLGFILSAKQMHRLLLSNVLRWPMTMFDTTPLGRILSRFSKDMEAIDIDLPGILQFGLSLFFSVISHFILPFMNFQTITNVFSTNEKKGFGNTCCNQCINTIIFGGHITNHHNLLFRATILCRNIKAIKTS